MDQESTSGPRKSGRVRQKRSFGDDFVDPDSIQQSEYTAKIRNGKSNNDTPSPTPSSNEEVLDEVVVEEDDPEKYPTEPPQTPVTSSTTSSLLKHIADTVSDGILKDIKEEIREKEEIRMKEAAELKSRIERNYSSGGMPGTSSTNRNNQWNRNGLPVKIVPKRTSGGGGFESFGALDPGDKLEYLVVDEERELEEAAAKNLEAIREANVLKILEKRSKGRERNLAQQAAQDAEINNYLTRNQGSDVLSQLPTTSGSRGPQFVRLNNRSIVVPPHSLNQQIKPVSTILSTAPPVQPRPKPPPNPPLQKFNLAGVPPNVMVGQFLRQQMAGTHNSGRSPAVRRININQIQKFREVKVAESPPKPKFIRKPPVGTPLPPPFSAASRHAQYNKVVLKTSPIDTAGPLPPYVPHGKQVAKILIKRGPNGELIPQGRVMIRTPEQGSQFRKAVEPTPSPPRLQPSQTHPGSLADIKPENNQPDFMDVKQEEEPEEVIVKEEPVDDYEPPVKQMKEVKEEPLEEQPEGLNNSTVDPNLPVGVYLTSQQQRPLPPPPPRQPPKPLAVFPRGSVTSLYDMVIHGNPKIPPTTPQRIFLGAEEPMKDMVPEEQYGRFSIRKVQSLNLDKFKWKSPVNGAQKIDMEPVKFRKFQSEGDALDRKKLKETPEAPLEDLPIRKKKIEEYYRQKRALAQKMTIDESQILEYMQSEEFKNSIKPDESASKFEQLLSRPNAFAEISEFSDSLSHTNPELFANLVRIFRMKHDGKKKVKVPDEVVNVHDVQSTSTAATEPSQKPLRHPEEPLKTPTKKPLDELDELEAWQEEEQLQNMLDSVPHYVEVEWFGVKANVPEMVSCHLCPYPMRLCMRKTKYRGETRSYPAYRCLAKGCQTFRSIKKQFRDTIRAGRPFGPSLSEPSTYPRLLEFGNEPRVMGRCEESLGEQKGHMEQDIKEEDPKEIKLEPDVEDEEEEEEEETVDFEYLTDNPRFEKEGSDEPLSEYDEMEEEEEMMDVEYECPFDEEE